MDGLEDGLNLCFQEKNDLEQYTRKSSIRITGLDDHDKDENIESSFRKFWFVWVRSAFITYWVPFSIFLFLQASSLCFLDINRTRKSSIRITGLDDHDKEENIEESIKTVHKFLTKTIKMEIKESDINIAHCMRPVSFSLTNIFPSCDHVELMFGTLYSSFRKFWQLKLFINF
jgi:hypothetical protein